MKEGIGDICREHPSKGPQLSKRKNNQPLIFSKNTQIFRSCFASFYNDVV